MRSSTKKFALTLLYLLIPASFLFAQDDMDDMKDMTDVKSQIEEMNSITEQAMLSGDYQSTLSYYTDDAISMPSYEPMIMGKTAIKEQMMKDNMGMKMTKFDLTTKKIFSEDDLVVEIGTYDLSLTMPGMPEPMDDNGKYLTIYEKQDDGSLKIKVETWNSNVNPWEKMGKMDMNHEMQDHDMNDQDKMEDTDKN